jgi:hypothetical protein
MRLKKSTILVLAVFSFAIAVVCILYCIDKQNRYQTLVEETPPAPSSIALMDSIETERTRILNSPAEELSVDELIAVSTLNREHDSLLHSKKYIADRKYWDNVSHPFDEQEGKLNTQYLLGVLGVLVGFATGVWSSIIFYTRRKMEILARSRKQIGPEVKY